MLLFAFPMGYVILIGLPQKVSYFYSDIDLEVTLGTTLQNRKPQMPSSA